MGSFFSSSRLLKLTTKQPCTKFLGTVPGPFTNIVGVGAAALKQKEGPLKFLTLERSGDLEKNFQQKVSLHQVLSYGVDL